MFVCRKGPTILSFYQLRDKEYDLGSIPVGLLKPSVSSQLYQSSLNLVGYLVNILGDGTNSDEGTGQDDCDNSSTTPLPSIEAQGRVQEELCTEVLSPWAQ